jgi:hypothetical protein
LLAEDVTKNSNESPSSSNSGIEIDKGGNKSYLETTKGDNSGNTDGDDYSAYFKDLIGGICRVPFSHDWGSMSYYNAIITGVDKPTAEEDSPKVGNCMEKDSPKVDNCKEILIHIFCQQFLYVKIET